LYGTTVDGGANGDGTVFLSLGLGPVVETLTSAAKAGTTVKIPGTRLTEGVNFNGNLATFTVVSSSEITTTVPRTPPPAADKNAQVAESMEMRASFP
jgi:hypothetical protein